MTQPYEDLEATYGPSATYREHKRGDHITYMTAGVLLDAGMTVWVQASLRTSG